jgi:hypothetical protein
VSEPVIAKLPAFGTIEPRNVLGLNEEETGIKRAFNPASPRNGHDSHRFPAQSMARCRCQPVRLKKLFS